ncbi:MAG: hypothetical protein BWY51_00031 [Parcubacteria group bacterium ADurb.Bin316]|nr:MAG: hypothetical protein BWY51_00031 [Parcubacteria group bacterium ADurb.Bin316]HOZ55996.1 hypothetical protein [bacterium]
MKEKTLQYVPSKKEAEKAEEMAQEAREMNIEDVSINLEKRNPYTKGTEQYEEVEKFFKEELPKYDGYVKENSKGIIAKLIDDGKLSSENNDPYGFRNHPILDDSGLAKIFYSGWIDPMDWDKGCKFTLQGFVPFQMESAARWIVTFKEKGK